MNRPTDAVIDAVANGFYHAPHAVLGPHQDGDGWLIRARRPLAKTVTAVLPDGTRVEVDPAGGFTLPNGAYVRRDASGALNLPNGARCVPQGRSGYLCP